MNNIYCTVSPKGENAEPYYLLPTNFKRGEDKYILGVKSNMVICIINTDNQILYDMPAPKELKIYAEKVKEFKSNPFYKAHMRRYFGKSTVASEEDI